MKKSSQPTELPGMMGLAVDFAHLDSALSLKEGDEIRFVRSSPAALDAWQEAVNAHIRHLMCHWSISLYLHQTHLRGARYAKRRY